MITCQKYEKCSYRIPMRLLSSAIILLAQIAYCSIIGISKASIQKLMEGEKEIKSEDEKTKCSICLENLWGSPMEKDGVSSLAACLNAEQHIFHAKCLAETFAATSDGRMQCPLCRADCMGMVYQILLTNCQDNKLTMPLRSEMLECLNTILNRDLDRFFEHINLMTDEYECMARALADTQFGQLKNAVAARVVNGIHSGPALYKYLTSMDSERIPANAYKAVLRKYIASGSSSSRRLNILRGILEREYPRGENRITYIANFLEILIMSPRVQLLADEAYTLALELLRHGLVAPARCVLVNSEAMHVMEASQALDIIEHCLGTGDRDGLVLLRYVWICSIYLRNHEPGEAEWAKRSIAKRLTGLDAADACEMRDFLSELYVTLHEEPLSTAVANKMIKEMAGRLRQAGTAQSLDCMAKSGVLRAIAHASEKDRWRMFKKMFDSWDAGVFKSVYMTLPESMTSIKIDMRFLKYFIKKSKGSFTKICRYINLLMRRKYFGYEMLLDMIDVFSSTGKTGDNDLACLWLLLAVKHQGILEGLEEKRIEALHKKLKSAKLFEGIALLEKPNGGKLMPKAIRKNIERIKKRIFSLMWLPQMNIMYQCTDTYIFAIWCKSITAFIRQLLAWLDGKTVTEERICFFIMSMCGSEYFASNIPDADVIELISMLYDYGGAALRYIDAFFLAARSERHVRAAKTELYKAYAAKGLTEEDAAALTAIGFKFVRGSPDFAVPDEASVLFDEVIDSVGKYDLLKLIRDRTK